jgi:hypothetical protein
MLSTKCRVSGNTRPKSFLLEADWLDQFSLVRSLSHSERNDLIAAQAMDDLAVGAVVEPQCDFDQMDTVVTDYRHESIIVVEDQGFVRNFGRLLPRIVILTVAYMPGYRAKSSLGRSTSICIVRVFWSSAAG